MVKRDKVFQTIDHIILFLVSLFCVLPLILLFASSFSNETAILHEGYHIPVSYTHLDYVTIQELTKNMAEYFRYLLSLKEDYVYLEDELQCIVRYAQVQKIRYQDNFQLRITCNADADEEKIPPLLIQTFIENSIKHNIMLVQDLEISLLIEEEGGMLHIIIKDNGLGFPVEILDLSLIHI